MAKTNETTDELRQYLLGLLSEKAEESVEVRLLSDASYAEEFDIVVDEIIDEYISDELEDETKKRVEQYFLKASQRKDKIAIARTLADYASSQTNVYQPRPSETLLERIRRILADRSWAIPVLAVVVLAIAVALVFLTTKRIKNIQAIALNLSSATRGSNDKPHEIKLSSNVDELKVSLPLPSPDPQAVAYKVQLVRPDGTTKPVTVAEHDNNTVVVVLEASELTIGTYALQVFVVTSDLNEHRIPGSYLFAIE